ncbi:MAG: bifunctional UDP-N-acetylglucosamine diphosphorylase/glucosamine-1-phosphate N-acetyltransferase GlmU [Caldisericia bacterium]|nr:bifunctional UDP-N-acetylglucosamine diphosphorylase/glucosamine-1-phosphate N-acetyltransferase GlmU [Caldisericia bacterium]MDD4614130.1 bifunctional UDP-N-acetylglucosamine diphosphorylase/glucosamine-1-phosphate N-acetyltransferase GlmU [Caldisericia bacterium]
MNHHRMACIILAAGSGTRMKSSHPKVLTIFDEKPILENIVEKAESMQPSQVIVVVSPQYKDLVQSHFSNRIHGAVQKEPLGTGDAFLAGLEKLDDSIQSVMVLCGDTPLIQSSTLQAFSQLFFSTPTKASLITALVADPKRYGRILRNPLGSFVKIIEWKDASEEEREISEINSGMYLFSREAIETHLHSINNNNASGEFYITDILESIQQDQDHVSTYTIQGEEEIIGINTKADLSQALQISNNRRLQSLMVDHGVYIVDPSSTRIGPHVSIGRDTDIKPNTWIEGDVEIGEDCSIGPFVCIRGDQGKILIESHCTIGPFTSLRKNCIIRHGAKAGTFVEMKNCELKPNSKANHLSYLGDAVIGERSNIGAGTITCNYDGFEKHRTIIEDDVFIGSDTIIVAPVTIEKGSFTGAGSVITQNVPPNALAIERNEQKNKENWAEKYRESKSKRRQS